MDETPQQEAAEATPLGIDLQHKGNASITWMVRSQHRNLRKNLSQLKSLRRKNNRKERRKKRRRKKSIPWDRRDNPEIGYVTTVVRKDTPQESVGHRNSAEAPRHPDPTRKEKRLIDHRNVNGHHKGIPIAAQDHRPQDALRLGAHRAPEIKDRGVARQVSHGEGTVTRANRTRDVPQTGNHDKGQGPQRETIVEEGDCRPLSANVATKER
jgi:hypothetical protein